MVKSAILLAALLAFLPLQPVSAAPSGRGNYVRLPMIDESGWITLEVRKTPFWEAGVEDPVLSNACRLGDFASFEANRLIIRFNGPIGQGFVVTVPPDRRHLLHDRRNLAAADETYYFINSGQPNCRVWIDRPRRERLLDTRRGTSLPPRDPNALQRRLDEIRTWPKCSMPDANGNCP